MSSLSIRIHISLEEIEYTSVIAPHQRIHAKMTGFEFDEERKTYGNYELSYGKGPIGHALSIAAVRGNVPLIEHIVKIGGTGLLHLSSESGWTPLFCAARYRQYWAVKKLVELGSNLNTATTQRVYDENMGETPEGATPLWAAVQPMHRMAIVLLLMRHGAEVRFPLADEEEAVLKQARLQIETTQAQSRQFLYQEIEKAMVSGGMRGAGVFPDPLIDEEPRTKVIGAAPIQQKKPSQSSCVIV